VSAVQQQFHILRAYPLRVSSHRRLHASARSQPRWSEQALPVEHICKFYYLGDMFVIYARICCPDLPYSQSGMSPMFFGPA
jgi:hypothetical protein